jgi:hypothetical protein
MARFSPTIWVVCCFEVLSVAGEASCTPDGFDGLSARCRTAPTPKVATGWVSVTQTASGWRVAEAPPAPKGQAPRALQVDDLIEEIDGYKASELGPLAVATILDDVPFRALSMLIKRNGTMLAVNVFREGVLTDGSVKSAPSYQRNLLHLSTEKRPNFLCPTLPDASTVSRNFKAVGSS